MSDSFKKWVSSILGLFSSFRPSQGLMFRTIESKFGRTFGKERLEFLFVYYNLLENSILAQDDNLFVSLTEKGFDFINGEESQNLHIYFESLKPLSNDRKDEIFANLWHIVGKKETCLCYVDGKTFFNSVSVYLPILGSYSEYMKHLHDTCGNTSRISWYKDLFYKLPDDGIDSFLAKLSELFNLTVVSVEKDSSEILDADWTNVSMNDMNKNMAKKNKIFISHCGKDKVAVNALVDLLGEVINLSSENCFCSSVHGFDVMLGKNFMDNIMEQYNKHNLLVLYVLSANYMDSPMCLNEMGASWMTKTSSIGILLPGFELDDLGNSCYDKQSISVVFNQDKNDVKHRLNQLKEIVESLFPDETKHINISRWEEKRDGFITTVLN